MDADTASNLRRCGPSALFAVIACWICAGCHGVRLPAMMPLDDSALQSSLQRSAVSAYPEAFLARLRVTYEQRGQEMTLTGVVRVDPAEGLRLLAIDDFGPTLFEVQALAPDAVHIIRRAPGLPEDMARSAGRDFAVIFLARPSPAAEAVRLDDGRLALVETEGGRQAVYAFDAGARQWTDYLEAVNQRSIYRVHLSDVGTVSGAAAVFARQIHIEEEAMGYRVALRILSFQLRQTSTARSGQEPSVGPYDSNSD